MSDSEIKEKVYEAVKFVDEDKKYEAAKARIVGVSKSIERFGPPSSEVVELLKPEVIKVLKALANEGGPLDVPPEAFWAFNMTEEERSVIEDISIKYLRRSEYEEHLPPRT
jgi:ABC-type histidine transport system ATPase subunit